MHLQLFGDEAMRAVGLFVHNLRDDLEFPFATTVLLICMCSYFLPCAPSMQRAVDFARHNKLDGFVAVGGGSVMDTAKVANLLSVAKDADIFDFVNKPMGKGQEPPSNLHPLIAGKLVIMCWSEVLDCCKCLSRDMMQCVWQNFAV